MRSRVISASLLFCLLQCAPVAGVFRHPGILHTQTDLDRVKQMVARGEEPWASGCEAFRMHPQSQSDWQLRGPFEHVVRGPREDLHNSELAADANAAYQNALMWAITGDEAHARKAIDILNAWSGRLKRITGHDKELAAALYGFKYVINEQGQCQESGRDQQHTQLGLSSLAEACEVAWNQGLDLYGAADNRLLKGFEYTAKYNLGQEVPFEPYRDKTGKYHADAISPQGRGRLRPVFEMVWNHYERRKGLAASYTKQAAERIRPEGAAWQADHPGFGTLLFTLEDAPPVPADYAVGADLSFLKQAEDRGAVFKDAGRAKPGLRIFRDHGYNWIRLRLFHTPTRLPNNLDYTIATAREAKRLGYKFLLNYHYSDTWADPGKQFTPKAWEGKSHGELVQAVRDYTRDTIAAFREAGAMPDMVQPGNEITPGMLWPDGRLPGNWDNFADLLKAASAGVEAGRGDAPRPRIMIHIDKGGNQSATKWFFDKLNTYDIAYDVIGQSYYPWWHGSLDDLRENMAFMAETYRKDIILVEVAYNWRPTEYKDKESPFPESPEGQREFLEQVHRIVLETPHGRGKGIFWWEPAVTGPLRSRGYFDDDGNTLPVIEVFDGLRRP